MADTMRIQLLTVSSLVLFGMAICLAVRQDSGHSMSGTSIEKWILTACVFFYALFSLIGVANDNVHFCRDAIACFFSGLAVYYGQHLVTISQTPSSSILSLVVLAIVLILVTPLAAFMMRLRCEKQDGGPIVAGIKLAAQSAPGPKPTAGQKIGRVGQSVRSRFLPVVRPSAAPTAPSGPSDSGHNTTPAILPVAVPVAGPSTGHQ